MQLNYKATSMRFRIKLRNRSPFFSMMERTMPSKSHSHISHVSLYKILYISFDSRNSSRSLDVSISLVNLTVRIFYIIGFVCAVSWNRLAESGACKLFRPFPSATTFFSLRALKVHRNLEFNSIRFSRRV